MKSRASPAALPLAILLTGMAAAPVAAATAVTASSVALPRGGESSHEDIAGAWGGEAPDLSRNLARDAVLAQTAGSALFGSRPENLRDGRMVSAVAADGGQYVLDNTSNNFAPAAGSEIVFTLDGARDLGRIEVFTAYQWPRTGHRYDIYTSTDRGANWSQLAAVNYRGENLHPSGWMARRVRVERPLDVLAPQVNAVKFVFPGNDPVDGAQPESVYNEIAIYGATAVLRVEQPAGSELSSHSAATTFGHVPTATASAGRLYTVSNIGSAPLTGIALEKLGPHAGDFTVTPPAIGPLAPGASTTFTVSFAPSAGGARSAQLSIARGDTDTLPFVVNLSGFGLADDVDTDGDAMSDAAEAALSALGFDWQTAQPALVGTLRDNAPRAGLFNREQFDASRVAGRAEVTGNPAAYGLYDSNSIMDLRMAGAVTMSQDGAFATVVIQPQTTADPAAQPFTGNGPPITNVVSTAGTSGFFRIKASRQ